MEDIYFLAWVEPCVNVLERRQAHTHTHTHTDRQTDRQTCNHWINATSVTGQVILSSLTIPPHRRRALWHYQLIIRFELMLRAWRPSVCPSVCNVGGLWWHCSTKRGNNTWPRSASFLPASRSRPGSSYPVIRDIEKNDECKHFGGIQRLACRAISK